jgi:hypothetical protein
MWNWVNFIAAALGAIGGPAAVYTIWSQRPRKLLLHYEIESRPAFPGHRRSGSVEMEFENWEIDDPHQVTLYLRPDGRKDIRTSDYDNQKLTLVTGAPVVGVVDQSTLDQDSVEAPAKSEAVKIAPQILKRGELVSLVLLVQGKPDPSFEAKLAEVDVQPFDHTQTTASRLSRGRLTAITGFAALMLFLSGVIGWNTARQADQKAAQLNQLGGQVAQAVNGAQAALSTNPGDPAAVQSYLDQLRATGAAACALGGSYSNSYDHYSKGFNTGGIYGTTGGANQFFCPDTNDKLLPGLLSPGANGIAPTTETIPPPAGSLTTVPSRP